MVTGRHSWMVLMALGVSMPATAAERSMVKVRSVVAPAASEDREGAIALSAEATTPAETVICTEGDANNPRIARGAYRNGQRHGKWTRWFQPGEGEMFEGAEAAGFTAPYRIDVELDGSVLHGEWTTYDAEGRRVSRSHFEHGKAEGKFTWFYPDGRPRRDAGFHNGLLEGELREWNAEPQQALTVKKHYVQGKLVEQHEEKNAAGQIVAMGKNLLAGAVVETTYDWYAGSAEDVEIEVAAEDVKHDHWVWFYDNGRTELEGDYNNGRAVGRFVWWYSNGQRQMVAHYNQGQLDGPLVMWHPNGQKDQVGTYEADKQVGAWSRWAEDGRLVEQIEYPGGDKSVLTTANLTQARAGANGQVADQAPMPQNSLKIVQAGDKSTEAPETLARARQGEPTAVDGSTAESLDNHVALPETIRPAARTARPAPVSVKR